MMTPTSDDVAGHASTIAAAAQAAIADWNQDDDGVDEELGTGGACDLVAEAISGTLGALFPEMEHATQWSEVTTHTSVIAKLADGVHEIDVPHTIYERGFGYVWRKIPDVAIEAADVSIVLLDRDPESYPMFMESQ